VIRLGRVAAVAAVILVILPMFTRAAAAQDTTGVRADSARAVPAQDSLAAPDSAATQEAPAPLVLSTPQPEVPVGPLPPYTRYVFTRDSLLWSSAETLGELLAEIPGVYLTRSGFLGEPTYVQYGGRGGSALKIFWDGMEWVPLGNDTLFAEPSQIPLINIRRVDVVVGPARLDVYLVSERHEQQATRSVVRIASGSFSSAAYSGMFQYHWNSGITLDLAANFHGTDGPNQQAKSSQFDLWAKVGWMPSDKVGATYQIVRRAFDRGEVAANGEPAIPELKGARTDYLLNFFVGSRADGLGVRAEGGLASSSWNPDSAATLPEERVRQAWAGLRYARPSWSAGIRGRLADARTTGSVEGQLGWVPLRGIVLAGDAFWKQHEGDRTSKGAHASAGLYYGFASLMGEIAFADAVQAPALLSDTAISTSDWSVKAGVDTKWLTGYAGLARRDAYDPLPYPDLPVIPDLSPSPAATYAIADLYVRPTRWLTLAGWYSDPVAGETADFQPPKHGRWEVTVRSKFWPTFRSGVFDLKLMLGSESWSTGTAGLDGAGQPIVLPGATFYEFYVSFQIVTFTGFWNLRNTRLTDAQYVPGLEYPSSAQYFGVHWTFSS
jgi:hypothetical protein